MGITELTKRPSIENNSRLRSKYFQFEKLLNELNTKELTNEIVLAINNNIKQLNAITNSEKELGKQLRKSQTTILKIIEKDLKLVPKNHYRNTWLAIGMSAFGIPLGVAFGASLGNMAFIGIGLPIGMAIGIAVGTSMDKKASDNGKQLDIEIKP